MWLGDEDLEPDDGTRVPMPHGPIFMERDHGIRIERVMIAYGPADEKLPSAVVLVPVEFEDAS
jgi:hypothetical protein